MMPDNELSSSAVVAGFSFPVKTLNPEDKLQDWELGGVALNDSSQGLQVKLWHFTLEIDKETGVGSVYTEAPFVAKTLMFAAVGVSEISGCFDQNMNPFVAYIQAGQPKIWWYDTLAVAQVHTDLPSGAKDLRCSLDDKRDQAVGDSDIFLSYIRDSNLIVCYQRDRYEIEYVLAPTVQRLVSMAMNNGFRMQWRAFGANANGYSDPYLGDIVYDLCRQSGIAPENIDVSELYLPTDTVPGLKIAVDEGFDKPIDWLREIFQFDKSQHGKKIHFPRRGRDPSFRIPFEHLVVNGNSQALNQELIDEKKLPRKVNINHIDSTGGFAKNKQTATRRSNLVSTSNELTIDSAVVLTPDQGASGALIILKARGNEQYTYKFSTTIRYTEITTGDVGEVEDSKGNWHRVRIEEKNEDAKIIAWEAIQDAGFLAYNSTVTGQPLEPPVSTTPGLVGDTILDIINFPVQRDQDDELGLYIAARGQSPGWSGYILFYSIDLGVSYTQAYSSENASNIGETTTSITDTGTAVEVLLPFPIESVTTDQIDAGYNRFVLGDEEVQVRTATLLGMVDGKYHYSLTNITRGILRTLYEPWPAGTRFIAMDASVIFARIQQQFYGTDIYYKAVSFGQSIDEVTPLAYLFDFAFSQTEWAVGGVTVVNNPGGPGLLVTWTPAPRIGTFGPNPFESKHFIGYRLKFSDGTNVDVPRGTTSYIYTGTSTGVTVRIFSLNDITGENAWGEGSGGTGGTGGGTGGSPGGNIGLPTELYGYGGTPSGGYAGIPYPHVPGDPFYVSGGFWDAQCFGEIVPGVCTSANGPPLSAGFACVGWPLAAGSYTTNMYPQASSPTPGGSGGALLALPITIYAYPTYSLIDLEWTTGYTRNVVNTVPPFTTFNYKTAGSDWSMPYTTGKVTGEIILGAAANPCWIGISNAKGKLTLADYQINIGYGSPCVYSAVAGHRYRIEHEADTGDWEIFKDNVSVLTGNLPLPAGKFYRMVFSGDYVQNIQVKYNFGGEAFVDTPTAGFGGILMPAVERPVVWRAPTPLNTMEFNGNLSSGPIYTKVGTALSGGMSFGHIGKSAGKWKVKVIGGSRRGLAVAAFDYTVGPLGDPGTADSIGYRDKFSDADPAKVYTCFGGAANVVDVDWLPAWELAPVWLCDFTAHTVKLCALDRLNPDSVVVVHTITGVPSGTWFPGQTGGGSGATLLTIGVPESGGYDEWTISYP